MEKITFIDPATLSIVANGASIIGGIASVASYFSERNENRRMLEKLDEITNYLKVIENEIQVLKNQNKQILVKLDEIPFKIEKIVEKIVDVALLNERYSSLERIKNNFLLIPGGEDRYLVHTIGWDELSENLTYLYLFENRISYLFNLFALSEFSILASNFQGTPIIKNLVDKKRECVQNLYNKVEDNYFEILNQFVSKIDNKKYIKSHNFSPKLNTLNEFKLIEQPNKIETEEYKVEKCETEYHNQGGRYNSGNEYRVCKYETKTRPNKTNINFNKTKAEHINSIKIILSKLENIVSDLIELRVIINILTDYSELIENDYQYYDYNKEIYLPIKSSEKSTENEYFMKANKLQK